MDVITYTGTQLVHPNNNYSEGQLDYLRRTQEREDFSHFVGGAPFSDEARPAGPTNFLWYNKSGALVLETISLDGGITRRTVSAANPRMGKRKFQKEIEDLERTPVYGNHYSDSAAFTKAHEIIVGDGPMEYKFRALKHIDKLTGETNPEPTEADIERYLDPEKAKAHYLATHPDQACTSCKEEPKFIAGLCKACFDQLPPI